MKATGSRLESALALQIRAAGLPEPVREYRALPPRRWRIDFAWVEARVGAEIDGATFSGGRHVRGSGYDKDCEKCNALTLAGWRVLRFTGRMVRDGTALGVLETALRV